MKGKLVKVGTFFVGDETLTGYFVQAEVEDIKAMVRLPMYEEVVILRADDNEVDRDTFQQLQHELAAVEEEAKTLRRQMDQKIGDFLAERVCCNGQDCGCMGITRYEQECGERLLEAQRDLAAAREEVSLLHYTHVSLRSSWVRVAAELAAAREALEFYADARKYSLESTTFGVFDDRGAQARAALAAAKEKP